MIRYYSFHRIADTKKILHLVHVFEFYWKSSFRPFFCAAACLLAYNLQYSRIQSDFTIQKTCLWLMVWHLQVKVFFFFYIVIALCVCIVFLFLFFFSLYFAFISRHPIYLCKSLKICRSACELCAKIKIIRFNGPDNSGQVNRQNGIKSKQGWFVWWYKANPIQAKPNSYAQRI